MDKRETINILCATDNNYAPYCGIMLTSLFDSNRDCHFVVYVFEDGSVTGENVKKYQRLAKKYGNEIVLKTIDESMVKGFPVNEKTHITLPTYFRLLAADLLPKEINKIIYLDCDVVVVGDIKLLWNVKLDGFALAGVKSCLESFADMKCNSLGYSGLYGYFNAGVLVYNLNCWRQFVLSKVIFEYIDIHYNNLPLMDQDALNGALFDLKKTLLERFNFMTWYFKREIWENYSKERQQYILSESHEAVVVHYVGDIKPWNYRRYGGPFFSVWEKYRRKSLWRECCDIKPLKKRVKHMVKRYLFPKLFRSQHTEWVVLPENKRFFK